MASSLPKIKKSTRAPQLRNGGPTFGKEDETMHQIYRLHVNGGMYQIYDMKNDHLRTHYSWA